MMMALLDSDESCDQNKASHAAIKGINDNDFYYMRKFTNMFHFRYSGLTVAACNKWSQ